MMPPRGRYHWDDDDPWPDEVQPPDPTICPVCGYPEGSYLHKYCCEEDD